MTDFYDILGVPKSASEEEIKQVYRRLAMQYHPDRNQGDGAAEAEVRFKKVKEAYECLGDAKRRAKYDAGGGSQEVDEEAQARALLVHTFRRAIDAGGDLLEAARHFMADERTKATKLRAEAATQRSLAIKKQGKVRTRDGSVNLLDRLLQDQITACDEQIARADAFLAMHKRAQALLDAYESTEPPREDDALRYLIGATFGGYPKGGFRIGGF